MTTSYTGNPLGVQAPDTAPAIGKAPVLTLPVDGEPGGVSSIYQMAKDLADHVAFNAALLQATNGFAVRAWEWPGYGDLAKIWKAVGGSSYHDYFLNQSTLPKCAFTKGLGLQIVNSTPSITVNAGFLGIYTEVTPPDFLTTVPEMLWGYLDGSYGPTMTMASAGQTRYSLVTAAINPVTLAITFTVTNGTSSASPTIPAVPAGQSLVAITKQSDTAVIEVYDCTIPFGHVESKLHIAKLCSWGSNWADTSPVSGRLALGLAATGSLVFPLTGDPGDRLLAVELHHQLPNGATVEFFKMKHTAVGGLASLSPVMTRIGGSHFTADDTEQTAVFKFMSDPILAGSLMPLWMHGGYAKTDAADSAYMLAVSITATGTGTTRVASLRTHIARG